MVKPAPLAKTPNAAGKTKIALAINKGDPKAKSIVDKLNNPKWKGGLTWAERQFLRNFRNGLGNAELSLLIGNLLWTDPFFIPGFPGGGIEPIPIDLAPFPVPILPGYPGGSWPGNWLPNNVDQPMGPGIITSVTPDGGTPPEGGDEGITEDGEPVTDVWQTVRFLRLGNESTEKVHIWVQYYTEAEEGKFGWSPEEPPKEGSLEFDIDPGEIVDLQDGDWRVNGQKARIWAKSGDRDYVRYKDNDLMLVWEQDTEGNFGYMAPEIQVFNFSIR